ncbi:MAG: hypothetical protein Q7T86_16565 [Hyphomicrobiaceae bacterium]|nr:hypothetical protein [Hyphomicrobiaceae bacterium]
MMKQLSLVACLAGVALPALAQVSTSLGWQHYQEPNANVELRYPAAVFKPDPSKTSPAGRVFVTQDGSARLLVGALPNAENHTPRSYQKFISDESYQGAKFDYAPVGDSWTVLSGTKDETMFYQKAFFNCGGRMITTFALTYPIAERTFYDPIVETIEDSFRPTTQCDISAGAE